MQNPGKKTNLIGRICGAIILMIFFIPIFFTAIDSPAVKAQYNDEYGIENEWTLERKNICDYYYKNAKKYTQQANSAMGTEEDTLKAIMNMMAFQTFCARNTSPPRYRHTPQEKSPFDY